MADIYNTTIDQGATWSLIVTYNDPNGDPINLTNATAALQLRTSPLARTAALTLDTEDGIVINPLEGTLDITATPEQTGAILPQRYTYDLELYLGNSVTRLIEGTILVSPETTRV